MKRRRRRRARNDCSVLYYHIHHFSDSLPFSEESSLWWRFFISYRATLKRMQQPRLQIFGSLHYNRSHSSSNRFVSSFFFSRPTLPAAAL